MSQVQPTEIQTVTNKIRPSNLTETPVWMQILLMWLKVAVWCSALLFCFVSASHVIADMSPEDIKIAQEFVSSGKPFKYNVMVMVISFLIVVMAFKVSGWIFDVHGVRKLKKKIRAWEAYQE